MQRILDVALKKDKMIKALKCKWNWVISKLAFKTSQCPYKVCTCKN